MVSPVGFICIAAILTALPARRTWPAHVATTTALLAALSWVNVGKEVASDWGWYTNHFRLLEYTPLGDYIGHTVTGYPIKASEPLYYALSAAVSRLTDGSIVALAIVVTVLIYGMLSLALAIILREETQPSTVAAGVYIALLMGVTFTLTTQLVRQEIAGATAMLGILLLWQRRYTRAIPLLTAAPLVHNSSTVLISAALLVLLATRRGAPRRLWAPLTLLCMLGAGLYWAKQYGVENGYEYRSDGSVSAQVILLDAAIFFGFTFASRYLPGLAPLTRRLWLTTVAYAAFLMTLVSLPIPFLRMYFYIEDLRTMMLAIIVIAVAKSKAGFWAVPGLVLLATIYLEWRIARSDFHYTGGLVSHLFRGVLL